MKIFKNCLNEDTEWISSYYGACSDYQLYDKRGDYIIINIFITATIVNNM